VSVDGNDVVLNAVGGALLKAKLEAGRSVHIGEAMKLMVRPEMLGVLEVGAIADNMLEARLSDVILVGGVTKTYAHLADGALVSATSLTYGPPRALEKNATVRLGWAKENGVLLPQVGSAV
jgi:hypothetical protein